MYIREAGRLLQLPPKVRRYLYCGLHGENQSKVLIGSEGFLDRESQSMGLQAYYKSTSALPSRARSRQKLLAHVVGMTSPTYNVSRPMPNSAGPESMLVILG